MLFHLIGSNEDYYVKMMNLSEAGCGCLVAALYEEEIVLSRLLDEKLI